MQSKTNTARNFTCLRAENKNCTPPKRQTTTTTIHPQWFLTSLKHETHIKQRELLFYDYQTWPRYLFVCGLSFLHGASKSDLGDNHWYPTHPSPPPPPPPPPLPPSPPPVVKQMKERMEEWRKGWKKKEKKRNWLSDSGCALDSSRSLWEDKALVTKGAWRVSWKFWNRCKMKKRKSVGNHLKYAKTTGIQTVSKHFKSTKYYNQNWDRSCSM